MGRSNRRSGQGFKTEKQKEKLKTLKDSATKRWFDHRSHVSDHTYQSTPSRSEQSLLPEVGVYVDSCNDRQEDCFQGRRVVELGILAEGLKGCKVCGVPLHLHHATGIVTFGLGAMITVPCSNTQCTFVNKIPTGKRHGRIWDANTKLTTAMVHAGVGGSQINSVFCTLNIPPVSNNCLYGRLTETGPVIEDIAKESANEYLKKESLNGTVTASVDAAWQKRGSGRSYDSLSGHCSMIGANTGKIINYSVRSKCCRICKNAEKQHVSPKQHDCRKNFSGSARSMESDMVIAMVKENTTRGIKTGTIVADDDTTTISRLRNEVDETIEKQSDKNHVKKNFSNTLFSLQKEHKSLSVKVINYLKKCMNYAIAQNSGNAKQMSKALAAMSKHPFGEHDECEETWCTFVRNPNAKYKSLPFGKPLTDKSLQNSLSKVFNGYRKHSEKLANLGSTQSNESFNKLVASKAPKSQHFSGSAHLNFRVAASVAQKNIGHKYLMKVHEKIGLSPGANTRRLAIFKDIQTSKKRAIAMSYAAKKKRLQLKANRNQNSASKEIREGTTYATAVDLQIPPKQTCDITQEIPPPKPRPVLETLTLTPRHQLIYFDLEATGLARTSHITQIAAVHGEERFTCHVMPKIAMTPSATEITGIQIRNGRMYHNNILVDTYSISNSLDQLIMFFRKYDKVVLVGHNVKVYDCPVLFNALQSCNKMSKFLENVEGFLDTKCLFKLTHPGMPSYAQQNLAKALSACNYEAHDAVEDVMALQKLVTECVNATLCEENYKSSTFSTNYALKSFYYSLECNKNLPSLRCMVESKVLSEGMARKVAGSGLDMKCLYVAHSRNDVDGIFNLFTESCGTNVRVTKSQKIINSVKQYLSSLQNES